MRVYIGALQGKSFLQAPSQAFLCFVCPLFPQKTPREIGIYHQPPVTEGIHTHTHTHTHSPLPLGSSRCADFAAPPIGGSIPSHTPAEPHVLSVSRTCSACPPRTYRTAVHSYWGGSTIFCMQLLRSPADSARMRHMPCAVRCAGANPTNRQPPTTANRHQPPITTNHCSTYQLHAVFFFLSLS